MFVPFTLILYLLPWISVTNKQFYIPWNLLESIHLSDAPILPLHAWSCINPTFNLCSLNRKSWVCSLQTWRCSLALTGGSLDRRRGEFLSCEPSPGVSLIPPLSHRVHLRFVFLSLHTETFGDHVWLSVVRTGRPALWNGAAGWIGGWMCTF